MEKIWYKNYDPGVPHTINPDQFSSLIQVLEDSFSRYPERHCYTNFGVSLTYKELAEYSQAFASYLQNQLGLVKGERILMMMPSLLQYPVAVFGALRAGLVIVNANPLSTYNELNVLLKNTQAKCVVVFENFAYLLEPAIIGTNVKHVIFSKLGDLFPFFKGLAANYVVKNVKKMVPKWHIPGAIEFKKCVKLKYIESYKKVMVDLTDDAFIQLSGGRTSGWENMVILTHRNIISNMIETGFWIETFFRHQNIGAIVNPFPFSRTLCMTLSFIMLKVGLTTILITNPRDIKAFVKEIKNVPFSMFVGINSLFTALLHNDEFRQLDFSHMKFTFAGGMAMPKSLAEKWKDLTGCTITQGYGLVEASPLVAVMPSSARQFTGKVGLPLPSTEVKICDDNAKELPINEVGELWIRGPQIFKGYLNDPEKTKQVLTDDGWLKTGDMATIDEGGYIQIIDRKEDMIMINGKRVFAVKVEEVIAGINGVFEVAVVVDRKENCENQVKAMVVRLDLNLTEEKIIQVCQSKLQAHEVPSCVVFCAGLPKSIAGYILRRVLREESVQVKLKSE